MEQREGRVDRVGWGRQNEGFIDVRFMLLKGTYEERIFHAVTQRDQWFQVLIGSKRKDWVSRMTTKRRWRRRTSMRAASISRRKSVGLRQRRRLL